jgi:hypothetical protein
MKSKGETVADQEIKKQLPDLETKSFTRRSRKI